MATSFFRARSVSFASMVGLATAWLGCGESTEVEYTFEKSQANPLGAEEQALVDALNEMRSEAGSAAVKVCFSLNVSASAHSDDMRDNNYLSDVDANGGTMRDRACAGGYQTACTGSRPMAELVAQGTNDGSSTLGQWTGSHKDFLVDPAYVVVGVGESSGGQSPYWTLDLADTDEPSCDGES